MLKKNLKAGKASTSDICSESFERKLMEPAPKKKDKAAETNE
jgi:hypothetical protein